MAFKELLLLFCLVLSSISVGYLGQQIITDYKAIRMYSYDNMEKNQFGLHGIYFTPEYYCVWTEGRSPSDIYATDVHEACHDLVHDDTEHFCGKYIDKAEEYCEYSQNITYLVNKCLFLFEHSYPIHEVGRVKRINCSNIWSLEPQSLNTSPDDI